MGVAMRKTRCAGNARSNPMADRTLCEHAEPIETCKLCEAEAAEQLRKILAGEIDCPVCHGQTRELLCLAEIRAIVGDPEGRLMQDELVARVREIVAERDRLKESR